MAAKRAKFKVEEISEEKPEVSLPKVEETPSEVVVETKPEIAQEEVAEPKDLGGSGSESSPDEIKDWLKDVKPDVSKEVEKSSSFNPKVVIFVIVLMLVVGAVVGGFFYYKKGVVKEDTTENTEPVPVTVVPSSEVSPTKAASEEVAVKDLKVQILNGSGKVGEAGVFKNALVKLGYTSGNITTGNAASYDFKDTEVSFKDGVSESLLETLKKELGDKYAIVKAKTALEKDSKFDISITVGTTK